MPAFSFSPLFASPGYPILRKRHSREVPSLPQPLLSAPSPSPSPRSSKSDAANVSFLFPLAAEELNAPPSPTSSEEHIVIDEDVRDDDEEVREMKETSPSSPRNSEGKP